MQQQDPTIDSPTSLRTRGAFPQKQRRVFVLLMCGFAVMAVLLGMDAWVGYRGTASVRSAVAVLTDDQLIRAPLIDDVEKLQSEVTSIERRIPGNSAAENDRLRAETDRLYRQSAALFSRISPNDPQLEAWRAAQHDLISAVTGINLVLADPANAEAELAALATDRERLLSRVADIAQASADRADTDRIQIEGITRKQSLEDRLLLVACLAVACLFLWSSVRIYRQMIEQAEELNNVSWQLLEKQETLARRLSRDLHDELGQNLTALKTNFSRHSFSSCVDPAWMKDCTELLRDSIQSAHEISQLLRPTLLDDFGLDTALAWLCDRFEDRHKVRTKYISDVRCRLDENMETHLFRLAQEALTNIARHAEASYVSVTLAHDPAGARLEIRDNGIGLPGDSVHSAGSFGLTGMKARARSLNGEMRIRSEPGRGTLIEVTFPLEERMNEKANSHPAR